MAETESTTTQDSTAAVETEPHLTQPQEQVEDTAAKLNNLTLRIWPLSQRTRDAVINRLAETLSSQSVLSKRYGTIPEDEASSVAKSIEEEAFSVAGADFSPDSDGIEILQMYSKEISKRMLDTVKSRAATAASDAPPGTEAPSGEQISSLSVKEEA
ncbi:WPP domain-containing protein 1 [Hibiscus syriacus]|uniref:WPP domain-containing protein 1 n=1 Tax=Hibiscus syriacus TaxID=106335 RepID=A0A6A3CVW0_HIBSY|nr:MFP1 attachment factor 1-like [Hibiscus syriacus]KAE8731321.1 WPP domain-containing protein 1 [Hibiscus syriacus]